MSYTKNYYSVLGLEMPSLHTSSSTTNRISTTDIRAAYKTALLHAHPDKKAAGVPGGNGASRWAVDDVKEAYAVLGDARRRAEFDRWLATGPGAFASSPSGQAGGIAITLGADFVLGLDLLDLSDFDVVDPLPPSNPSSPTRSSATIPTPNSDRVESADEEDAEATGMEWTRACRCGAEKGFRIVEEELEAVSRRGEKEVLVGCEGCSLWVRVAFDVEEDG